MSANVIANKVIYNEINDNIVNLFKLFINNTPEEINSTILTYINKYNLNTEGTDVRQNNPNIKEIRDYYNKNYLKFREDYNKSERDYLMLYTLTFYSFSNLIRFNNDNKFNMPYGNRCYCNKHYEQIKNWYNVINNKNIEIYQKNAFDILKNNTFDSKDFIYLDPAYINTMAIYNEQRAFGGWNIEDDYELFNLLEELNTKGIKWGLSNVFRNKDNINQHLIDWCLKNNWNVIHLNGNYSSLGKGNANTDEVFICNFKKEGRIMEKKEEIKVISYETSLMIDLEKLLKEEPDLFNDLVKDYPVESNTKIIIEVKA